ncbi:hypothetical protein A2884_02380 [Candidatus Saccharibacteria bacterium RIFCSPHIGHO2_01_FULL_48_12]|nr:MAG: hypothetical protein A2884_02380 [Candidatus Saccharibacteria bacterium RIFCSPHIGHO2_01_FULL_48_12]
MKKDKKFGWSKRPASIDGISSSGRHLGAPIHRSYRPAAADQTPDLNQSLDQPDGFHPMRTGTDQPLGTEDIEGLDEPIMLDEPIEKPSKKRQKLLNSRHKKTPSRRRKVLKRIGMVAAIVLVAFLGAMGYKFYDTQRQILAGGGRAPAVCDTDISPELLSREGDSRINILLVGIGGPEHADGTNATDTIMISSIDPVNNTSALLSIPRDLWVHVPGDGSQKINAVYLQGLSSTKKGGNDGMRAGLALLDKTLDDVLDIPIHYHVLVDFAAFREVVNAVGGIDINVPEDLAVYEQLWDEATGKHYTLDVKPGQQHFDGTKALFFARSRKTSPRGDFDRSERQRLVLVAMKDKVLSAGTFSNPVKVVQLLDSLGQNIYTDFDTESIKCIYERVSKVPASAVKSLDMANPPNELLTTANLGGTSIVRPKAGLFAYDDINTFIRNSLRDGFIVKENSAVAVYNATSSDGLATEQADLLKSYGYNVTTVDSASNLTNPTQTVVIDLSSGADKYTRRYLESRYSTTATGKVPSGLGITPPAGTRFVIILGSDAKDSQN